MSRRQARVYLERPSKRRQAEFLRLEQKSRKLHRPWVYAPSTEEAYAEYLKESRKRSSRCFLVCMEATRELAGVANITHIIAGCFQSAYLGFYAFAPHARRGYMTEGVTLLLDETFKETDLHRLEANVQPNNAASLALVKKLGFHSEGYSPKYLKLGGRWRDHERWAILREEWRSR